MKDINYNLTPGPWKFVQHESGNDVQWRGLAGYSVQSPEEGIAYNICRLDNARLIAAAPDLLEILQAAMEWHDGYERRVEPWYPLAKAAIAKATSSTDKS